MAIQSFRHTREGEATQVRTKGRHDPCVGIRAVPVGEAMVACAIADHYLRDRGQVGVARHTSHGSSPQGANDGGPTRHD